MNDECLKAIRARDAECTANERWCVETSDRRDLLAYIDGLLAENKRLTRSYAIALDQMESIANQSGATVASVTNGNREDARLVASAPMLSKRLEEAVTLIRHMRGCLDPKKTPGSLYGRADDYLRESGICPFCGQKNANWAKECGRCSTGI